tara:strand:- start:1198 stop:1995 length:798 start_codon:yes stop_codon:yes gene_type:complete
MISNFNEILNIDSLENSFKTFNNSEPFDHCYVDNFFNGNIAKSLEEEFPGYESDIWHGYNNPLEVKKVCNNWNIFPAITYSVFSILSSQEFTSYLSQLTGISPLYPDIGLNGAGWHIHKKGGKLNTHLDYSIHPKRGLLRKINLIVYLNSNWKDEWGGALGLWDQDPNDKSICGELIKRIPTLYNRGVFFDTVDSWHGLPEPLTCPENEYRKSIAVYYLTTPTELHSDRGKALFSPTDDQKGDDKIKKLIKERSSVQTANKVYNK